MGAFVFAPVTGAAGIGAKALLGHIVQEGEITLSAGSEVGQVEAQAHVHVGVVETFVGHGGAQDALVVVVLGAAAGGGTVGGIRAGGIEEIDALAPAAKVDRHAARQAQVDALTQGHEGQVGVRGGINGAALTLDALDLTGGGSAMLGHRCGSSHVSVSCRRRRWRQRAEQYLRGRPVDAWIRRAAQMWQKVAR